MLSNATIQSHQIFQNSISNIQNSKKIASYIWDNVGGHPELIDSPLRGEKGLRHQGAASVIQGLSTRGPKVRSRAMAHGLKSWDMIHING